MLLLSRIYLVVDGRDVASGEEHSLGRTVGDIRTPSNGGLFIGGVPSIMQFAVQSAGMTETVDGFYGNIEGISFLDKEDGYNSAAFNLKALYFFLFAGAFVWLP